MEPQKYRPMPDVEIEAVPWTGNLDDLPAEWRASGMLEPDGRGGLIIHTLEGIARPRVGDYIARGTATEMYPIRQPIFQFKYIRSEDWLNAVIAHLDQLGYTVQAKP